MEFIDYPVGRLTMNTTLRTFPIVVFSFVLLTGTPIAAQSLQERIEEIVFLYYEAWGRETTPATIKAGTKSIEAHLVDGWSINEIEQLVWRILNSDDEAGARSFEDLVAQRAKEWGKPGPNGWVPAAADQPTTSEGSDDASSVVDAGARALPADPEPSVVDAGARGRPAEAEGTAVVDAGARGRPMEPETSVVDAGARGRPAEVEGTAVVDAGARAKPEAEVAMATPVAAVRPFPAVPASITAFGDWAITDFTNPETIRSYLPTDGYLGRTSMPKESVMTRLDSAKTRDVLAAAEALAKHADDVVGADLERAAQRIFQDGFVSERIDLLKAFEKNPSPLRMKMVAREFLANEDADITNVARIILSKKADARFTPVAIYGILHGDAVMKKECGRLLREWADPSMIPALQDLLEMGDPVAHPYIMAAMKSAQRD